MAAVSEKAALRPGKDFSFLKYNPNHEAVAETAISVTHDGFWSYCGPLLGGSGSGKANLTLPGSFYDFSNASIEGPVVPNLVSFISVINGFLSEHGLDHYLLTVRAMTPTHDYDVARWHTDELFFSNAAKEQKAGTLRGLISQHLKNRASMSQPATDWKICTVLLGLPTMFIPQTHQKSARDKQRLSKKAHSTDHTCASIRCVACAATAEAVQQDLASQFAQYGTASAAQGECAVFRVGPSAGAVHCEPCMSASLAGRIFVNVVPGTKDEIETLASKWGMGFPRHWWVGKWSCRVLDEAFEAKRGNET